MIAPERPGAFYGRRKGKKLRAGQGDHIAETLPRLRLPSEGPIGLAGLFPRPMEDVALEIGFGGGEHLLARARENRDRGFIGCEPFVNGMAKLLAAAAAEGLDNIRVWDGDAALLLPRLPDAGLNQICLLYPDPWPKRRQRKRRFVSDATLAHVARLLRPGGEFRFASDIDDYVGWTLAHAAGRDDLVWRAASARDWKEPWAGWPGTRYEAKALREGRTPSYLTFERI